MIKLLILFFIFNNVFAEDVIWLPRNPKEIKLKQKTKEISEFDIYLKDFQNDIEMTDVQIKRLNAITIKVLDYDEPQSFYGNAICLYSDNKILISHNKWIVSSQIEKQQLIDHELGHCIFGRIHVYSFESIMNVNNFEYTQENKKRLRKELMDQRLWNQLENLTQRIKRVNDPKKIKKIELDLVNTAIK